MSIPLKPFKQKTFISILPVICILASHHQESISVLTLPLQEEAFVSPVLFPFFDGLIPEGWLLDVALRNTDISILDRMSLLLLCCKECIGSVSVVPIEKRV